MSGFTTFIGTHWLPASIWALTAFTNGSKVGTWPTAVQFDPRWHPILAIVVPQVGAVLVAVQGGSAWGPAALHGLEVSVWSMGLYDVVTKAFPGLAARFPWLGWLVAFVPQPDAKAGDTSQ